MLPDLTLRPSWIVGARKLGSYEVCDLDGRLVEPNFENIALQAAAPFLLRALKNLRKDYAFIDGIDWQEADVAISVAEVKL